MTQQSGRIWVMGGRPLNGTAAIPAAKNSVLPLLAAALLCRGPVRLRAVPRLSDVECSLGLLRGAGCAAHWQGADIVVAGMPSNSTLPGETAAQMRASILFCAPLLARLGEARIPLPGGCAIGQRPIDQHLKGMSALGAKVRFDHGGVTLGDGCQIGHNVVFATLDHGIAPAERRTTVPAPIVLGRNVWVGSNATILRGVTIGDNAVVAARRTWRRIPSWEAFPPACSAVSTGSA